MSLLHDIGIVTGRDQKAESVFESLFPSFLDVEYSRPSEYVRKYWEKYKDRALSKGFSNTLNGRIFEYVLATLIIREKILPLYLGAKVAFVPNVIYDLMLYTTETGPICISAKTSLRERYKQADLEAIALKYVHRKSISYLVTLDEGEAQSVQKKIKSGDVIGLDKVIIATSNEFDQMLQDIKQFSFSEPPTIKVISAAQVITLDRVKLI